VGWRGGWRFGNEAAYSAGRSPMEVRNLNWFAEAAVVF